MLNRAAEPDEIIDFVIFLASEKGQFFDGTNVLIDGGRDAMERRKYGDK
jgi:NAD(P)-dependent dehydrogenase (short-subunit alcohol dehydrogenase family)